MKKLLICLFTVVLFSCNNSQDEAVEKYNNAPTKIAEKPVSVYAPEQEDSINLKVQLDKLTGSNYYKAKERHTVSSIEEEADDFADAQHVVYALSNKETEKAKKFKSFLKEMQAKEFPVLRKNYVEAAAKRMWEEDVEVNGQNDWISFTGGSFAAHRVIAASEEALHDMLLKLRFKTVVFEWIRNASDGTRYRLNSKEDTDP